MDRHIEQAKLLPDVSFCVKVGRGSLTHSHSSKFINEIAQLSGVASDGIDRPKQVRYIVGNGRALEPVPRRHQILLTALI